MANIDQLSIEINADADKASEAITKLTSHLNGLSSALKNINDNSISKFARSMESLAKTGRTTDAATKSIEGMAKALSSEFGIKSKEGIQAVTNGLLDLAEASKQWQLSDFSENLEGNFKDAQSSIASVIHDYAKIEKALDDDSKAVVDFVEKTRKGSVSISNFAQEFGDDFAQMKRTLGKGFTSELDATKKGIQDFEDYMVSLKEATNVSMFDNLAPDEAFRKLSEVMNEARNSTMSFSEAVQSGVYPLDYAERVIDQYQMSIDRLVMQQDKLTKENGIDALVNSLKGLSEVSVPDFSSFAHAIETLNRVNVDKVTRNLQRVKETLAEGTQKAVEMTTALQPIQSFSFDNFGNVTSFTLGISEFVNEIEQKMLPAIRESGELVVSMAANFQPLVEVANNANEIIVVMNGNLERAGYFIEDMTSKMAEFIGLIGAKQTSVPLLEDFRAYKPDIVDTVEVIQMGMYDMTNSALDFESAWRSLAEEFMTPDFLMPFEDAPEDIRETTDEVKNLAAQLNALSSLLRKLSGVFGSIANAGIKAFKGIANVIKNVVVNSFKVLEKYAKFLAKNFEEETEGIKNAFTNMSEALQGQMARLSAFWQRTLRTFTFMLVRKAITAVIKDVKSAVDELVLFEKHLGNLSGGAFNNSVSQILADFHLIGRAIVAAFEPLINWVVPIINAVASAIANVLATLGEFFAAFTGQNYFVKARKTVVDYGSSLEDAEDAAEDTKKADKDDAAALDDKKEKIKEIKKLLLGIDELNILPKQPDDDDDDDKLKKAKDNADKVKKQKTPKGSGINYKDAFEEKPVSDAMKNLVDKIKQIMADLFDPIKKAWDKVYPYLKQSWEYMGQELLKLFKSIGSAFLEAWKTPVTEHIFEMLFTILGDLMTVIGNLAKGFREAWDSISDNGKRLGVEIFESLLEIIDILITHVQKVTDYMKDWSAKINFKPLLSGIRNVLNALKPLADFLGGVFEDVMKNIVLEHIRYLIEEGLPHLCHAIEEVLNAFDFDKLRTQLQPIEQTFEKMRQQIHEGLVNAMKNLGIAIGQWTQTENFQKFLDGVQHFMEQITVERVEKLFTGLGLGILKIVEALADFVGSDEFKQWTDDFFAWYDSLSAEDIAKFFEGIANGIGKLAMGIGKFVFSDSFKKFIEKLTKWYQDLSADDISKFLEGIADGLSELATQVMDFVTSDDFYKFVDKLVEWYKNLKSGDFAESIKKIATAIGAFTFASFVTGGVANFLDFISKIGAFAQMTGIPTLLTNLGGAIGKIGSAAATAEGGTTGFSAALAGISSAAAPIAAIIGIVIAAFASLAASYGGLQGVVDKVKETFNQAGDAIKKFAEYIKLDESINKLKTAFDNLKQKLEPIKKAFDDLWAALGEAKPLWDMLFNVLQKVAMLIGGALTVAFKGFVELLTGFVEKFAALGDVFTGVIDIISGVVLMITGFFKGLAAAVTGDKELFDEAVRDYFGGVVEIVAGVIEEIKGILDFFGQPILDILNGFFPGIKDVFDQFVQDIVDFFKDLKYQLIGDPIVIDMVEGIVGWFETLCTDGTKWVSDLVTGVLEFFGQLATDAVDKAIEFKDNCVAEFEEFKENASTKFNEFKEDAVKKVVEFKDGAVEKFEEFKTGASEKFNEFKEGAAKTFDEAKTKVVETATKIKDDSVEKFNKFKEESIKKFDEFKTNAPKKFEDAKKKVVDYAKDMKEKVVDKIKDMGEKTKDKFDKIKDFASEKFKAAKDKIKERMDESVKVTSDKLDKIKSKFEKLSLENVGKNLIRGFLSGIKTIWADVVSWASQALANFKSKFAAILQIHSPSKVFMKYGEYTVEGFNKGLETFSSTTGKTVDKWVESFADMDVTINPKMKTNISALPLVNDQKLSMENNGLTKEDLVDVLRDFGNSIRSRQTNGETRVILELDGRQLYEQVVRQDKQQLLRTGRSSFAY